MAERDGENGLEDRMDEAKLPQWAYEPEPVVLYSVKVGGELQ